MESKRTAILNQLLVNIEKSQAHNARNNLLKKRSFLGQR